MKEKEEFEHFRYLFEQKFEEKPDVIARTSGRVNIIGEHVDYMGFSVMPITINKFVYIALLRTDRKSEQEMHSCMNVRGKNVITNANNSNKCSYNNERFVLKIENNNSSTYPSCTYHSYSDIYINEESHKWCDYIVAAYLSFFEYIYFNKNIERLGKEEQFYNFFVKKLKKPNLTTNNQDETENVSTFLSHIIPFRFIFFVHGNVPQSAGLSSSSSIVVCAMFCMFSFFKEKITKLDFAKLCAKAERYVGVSGGGMDQAVMTFFSGKNDEKFNNNIIYKINMQNYFFKEIALPAEINIFILNTFVQSSKANSKSSKHKYNKRVLECKLAAILLLLKLNLLEKYCEEKDLNMITLRDVQEYANLDLYKCHEIVEKNIRKSKYLKYEIRKLFDEQKLNSLFTNRKLDLVWRSAMKYDLYNRAMHVFTEAVRVERFEHFAKDPHLSEKKKIELLGELMNLSNDSLHEKYKCGCPELGELSKTSRFFQDSGNKLTGAGWGGCIVSFVTKEKLAVFLEGMKSYFEEDKHNHFKDKTFNDFCFQVHSAPGITNYLGDDIFI